MECHFFHTGKCRKGAACNFQHTEPPLGYCPREKCPLCKGATRKEPKPRGEAPVAMEVEKPKKTEEVVKESAKEFKGKIAELPKWEEKEPGTKLLPSVVIGKKPEPEPELVVEERRPHEYRGGRKGGERKGEREGDRRDHRRGGGRGGRGDRDARAGEADRLNSEQPYAPDNRGVDEELIKAKRKEDAAYQIIADGKKKAYQIRVMEAHQDLQIFKPLEKVFQEKLSLDLMFILDCTGSMSSWIKAAKQELFNIIDFVMQEHEGAKIFISVVAYRDICDKEKNLQVLPFTNQRDTAHSFISQLSAMGGGDTPEDVCGGFQEALKQDWKSNARYALLITDAPCHGKKYHSDTGDTYPAGDPQGRDPEKQIIQLVERGVNLYGIKITNLTDTMFRIFSEVYQSVAKKPMTIADLGQGTGSFGFFVANTVTATLSSSVVNSDVSFIKRALRQMKELKRENKLTVEQQISHLMKLSELPSLPVNERIEVEEKRTYYSEKFEGQPNWRNLQQSDIFDVVEHTYFIVKDKGVPINWRKPLLQNSQIKSRLQLARLPFAEGGMRYAFYAYDLELDQKLVIKENKSHKYNTIDQMSRDLQLVYICQHLVNTFNASVVEYIPDSRLLLTFVHTFLVEVPKLEKMFYAENFIEGVYEKFNNNAGWASNRGSESSFISQAFSHYSYQATEGYLMVVDLQGASGILTDPQIHCLDSERFGAGNLGYEGILKFFFGHRCNNYCKSLGLVNPKLTAALPPDFSFYSQEIPAPADYNKKCFTICDLCKGAFTSTCGFVYRKRLEDQLKYCRPCDDKRKATMRKGNCEWCNTSFNSSEYWFKMMRTDFPTLCGDCRKKRREKWRKELEQEQAPKNGGEVPKPPSAS